MMRNSTSSPTRTAGHSARGTRSRHDQDMDIDSQYGHDANSTLPATNTSSSTAQINDALKYAQELNADYKADASKEVTQMLSEIFALFAYEDPRNSPASGLLDIAGRLPVAEGLNSAILGKSTNPSPPSLPPYISIQNNPALLIQPHLIPSP